MYEAGVGYVGRPGGGPTPQAQSERSRLRCATRGHGLHFISIVIITVVTAAQLDVLSAAAIATSQQAASTAWAAGAALFPSLNRASLVS